MTSTLLKHKICLDKWGAVQFIEFVELLEFIELLEFVELVELLELVGLGGIFFTL